MSDGEAEVVNKPVKRPHEDDANEENGDPKPDQANNDTQENPFRTNGKVKKKKKKHVDDASTTEESVTVTAPSTVDGEPQITSKRQKKRMKNVQAMAQRKDDDNVKTIAYLNKWQENRSEWKFEKLRQIAIQKNILNEKMIPDELFEVAVAYLATTQGKAREHIIEFAEKAMDKFETEITDENRDEIINSRDYKRARELLQSMN